MELASQTSQANLAILLVSIVVLVWQAVQWRARSRGRPLPPGPRGLPVLGNWFNVPKVEPWVAYRDLCSAYGDILHFRVLGQSTVVLGSATVMTEYLNKNSVNTSDRKQTPLIELTGGSINFGHLPYGQSWRRHRRAFAQHFNQGAVTQYKPFLVTMARSLVEEMMREPSRLQDHLQFNFITTLLKLMYGIEVTDKNDKHVAVVNEALSGAPGGGVPGKLLLKYFSWMQHVPEYVPGFGFRKQFAKWQAAADDLKNVPFAHVKSRMDCSMVQESAVGISLNKSSDDSDTLNTDEEEILKNIAAISFDAGTDTTLSTIQSALQALSLNREALRKVQAELDSVVGPNRLPDFADQSSMVYLSAVIKETLRWHPAVPFGVPHCTTEDDEFQGYFIPKNTVLIPNIWACMHDADEYGDPETFRPERFIRDGKLECSGRDPVDYVFGFGRRVCPGRQFAEAVIFINLAAILQTFDLVATEDKCGRPIVAEMRASDGLLSYPACKGLALKPRSISALH